MKTNFKKRLLISIGIILGSVIIATAVLSYLSGDMTANAAKLVNDRATLQAQTTALGKLAELQRDAPLAANYQTAINMLLPDMDHLIDLSHSLDDLAHVNGVAASITFQGNPTPPAAGTIGIAPFSLDIQGPLSGVVAFEQSIESHGSYLLKIDSFDLTADASNNAHLIAQGGVYYQ